MYKNVMLLDTFCIWRKQMRRSNFNFRLTKTKHYLSYITCYRFENYYYFCYTLYFLGCCVFYFRWIPESVAYWTWNKRWKWWPRVSAYVFQKRPRAFVRQNQKKNCWGKHIYSLSNYKCSISTFISDSIIYLRNNSWKS